MIISSSTECQIEALLASVISEDSEAPHVKNSLCVFLQKLRDSMRSPVRRSKERCLEEACQILKNFPSPLMLSLQQHHRLSLVQLLLALQMDTASTASACRKIDKMLLHLAQFYQSIVSEEVQKSLSILYQEQVLSFKDLQIICMFLEDSTLGQEALRQACPSLLDKVAELFPFILKEEALRNGSFCYQAVKVCLQVFQLLTERIKPLVFGDQQGEPSMTKILEFLMNIILGETSNRDTRLLAGTAVAMLISTATDSEIGGSSAWSLLQVSSREQWRLTVGGLQIDCCPRDLDGLEKLAVARGLLTCCKKDILISRHTNNGTCLLLDGLFPLISTLHKKKLNYQYHVFQVFIMWLKSLKECLLEISEMIDAPLLGQGSSLRHTLAQIIWNNAESPVEGISDSVRSAFSLFLEIYDLDCQHSGDSEKSLYVELLQRIAELPWESKAKYSPLSALLPYVGTDKVLEQYPALPCHILKCLSTNYLAPCASEIYKSFLQEQRQELSIAQSKDGPPTELYLAQQWAQLWQPMVLTALTSDVTLLHNNGSSYLLPSTLRCFPGAFDTLLCALDPTASGHLQAWVCIMSAQRSSSGHSPWASKSPVAMDTLRLALSSLDDNVRLAAFNFLCCSPKTKEAPTQMEYSTMKGFLPLNLNSESSPFRQHLQAGVKKFLVRIRDSCMASLKCQRKSVLSEEEERELEYGVDFVEWLAYLPLTYLVPGNSFQRKKTALLLLNAVLETYSDCWSPDRKKGQPPANMSALINWARDRGKWDFFSRSRQLVLISNLEDSTNEIREQVADLLVRFFPCSLQGDVVSVLLSRAQSLLQSPRVQEAQMGALIVKLLLQKCASLNGLVAECGKQHEVQSAKLIGHLLKSLEQHYVTAKEDMLLAARSSPLHGVVSALQRCLLEVPGAITEGLDHSVTVHILSLLEKITLLLLGVLYGDHHTDDKEVPPSFCDMGNAISSLIGQGASEGVQLDEDGEENVLLSEEHSLILTCCWVTLKEIGIFLGLLVERILSCKETHLLTVEELQRASKLFKDIILKCRHWGAVEGCCIGFIKFCSALLTSYDPQLRAIPGNMLQQGLSVLQAPRATSVTRRAAGLPMLILSVLAAEENSTSRPLLAHSVNTLLETARSPLPQDWDQTVDLPQVCAVHTLQTLVRGSSLGLNILQYASSITMLSLTLLSSPCWAMRNAALQLYSSLCSRMLGQRPAGEEVSAQHCISPTAFFSHYPDLQPFLQGALESAAADLHEGRLSLHPSLYPVLTLLAKLQPGAQEQTHTLSDFLPLLLQLAASPLYAVRVMSSRALVAMIPPTEYLASVLRLVGGLPQSKDSPCCHNLIHGQLLQIKAILLRALQTNNVCVSSLSDVVEGLEARIWLVSPPRRCPLVQQEFVSVLKLLRDNCSKTSLSQLCSLLLEEIHRAPHTLELGSVSFHQSAVQFLCEQPEWAWKVWQNLSNESTVVQLSLIKWIKEGQSWKKTSLQKVLVRTMQDNLKEALLDQDVEYRRAYLASLVEVLSPDVLAVTKPGPPLSEAEEAGLQHCVEILLDDLQDNRGGPELLSQALCAVSLLLSQSMNLTLLQRWCVLLEKHSHAEATEALRLACAQALSMSGAAVVIRSLRNVPALKTLSIRLISIGVHLLQDECQQVRTKAAVFASVLCQPEGHGSSQSCFLLQVNQSLSSLLDLLLKEFWDSEGTLEALVCHLPECDLSIILQEAKHTQCSSLYEQDEANVFLEPSVISETVLPYLICLAKRYPESSSLAEGLDQWASQNVASVRENLDVCMKLQLGDTLNPDWLSVLMKPRFHGNLCGLFARAAFLLQLLRVSDKLYALLDPLTLAQDLLALHTKLSMTGVFLSNIFINSVTE
ncbi:tRNA (32-2'-O)-methyltransferase regulator THADA-like [Hoplias malabaricus]|uniref:tRNA (32-2'-O)-methyltransferase regulator THADA-like n=1 Tax=Hoplias malabaricus TaxID=27720 RepID=UPI003462AB0B